MADETATFVLTLDKPITFRFGRASCLCGHFTDYSMDEPAPWFSTCRKCGRTYRLEYGAGSGLQCSIVSHSS